MDPTSNPFRPGAGTSPPALRGRDAILSAFDVTLARALDGRPGKSVMPIGLRGVGKTVLLNRFLEIAQERQMRHGFIEAPETGDFRRLLALRLRSILLDLDRGKTSQAVTRALGILKAFSYTLPDGSSISIDVDAYRGKADSGVIAEDVTDLFVAIGEAAMERETGMMLAVDEVQYLDGDELGALITAIHRTSQLDLPVVLVGAGLPQLPGLAGDAKSYAERLFEFPLIGSLGKQDARDVLRLPVEANRAVFEDDALILAVEEAQGYPYFLQEWGYRCWNAAHDDRITIDDVRRAAPDVRQHLDENFFLVRLDRLTPAEKRYLRAMAELGEGPHRSGDIATMLGVKVESVAPRRSGLIQKGMVYSPAHGDTAFTVPVFDQFLRRSLTWDA
jgi:AAA ATPase domain